MFGPVFTTEAHLAFAGARFHSNSTAEISAVEALSFLGPHGPVARDACSCVFYHFKYASGVCLGTILARTDVQLGLSCQQLLLKVQHRPRFTMQHVYSHAENLGNECADHAAALGAFGLVSNHNLSTRWTRHSFDSACALVPASTLEMFWKINICSYSIEGRVGQWKGQTPRLSLPPRALSTYDWNPMMELLFHVQISGK